MLKQKIVTIGFPKEIRGYFREANTIVFDFLQHDTSKFWKQQSQNRNNYRLVPFSKTKIYKSEKN